MHAELRIKYVIYLDILCLSAQLFTAITIGLSLRRTLLRHGTCRYHHEAPLSFDVLFRSLSWVMCQCTYHKDPTEINSDQRGWGSRSAAKCTECPKIKQFWSQGSHRPLLGTSWNVSSSVKHWSLGASHNLAESVVNSQEEEQPGNICVQKVSFKLTSFFCFLFFFVFCFWSWKIVRPVSAEVVKTR